MLPPYQPTGFAGLLRARRGAATVAELLARLGIAGVSPHHMVRDLDLPVRQKIEIARTLFRKPRILLLDEPTSALSGGDIEWLANIVAAEKARGTTVVFISHRMPEVRLFCDALSVLRNGRNVGTYEVAAVTDHDVVELIIGRSLTATFPPKPERQLAAPPVLSVADLSAAVCRVRRSISGRARSWALPACKAWGSWSCSKRCSATSKRTGSIRVDGRPVTLHAPSDAVAATRLRLGARGSQNRRPVPQA